MHSRSGISFFISTLTDPDRLLGPPLPARFSSALSNIVTKCSGLFSKACQKIVEHDLEIDSLCSVCFHAALQEKAETPGIMCDSFSLEKVKKGSFEQRFAYNSSSADMHMWKISFSKTRAAKA